MSNDSETQSTNNQAICSVSLKLPEFWFKSPEVWFAKIEAQFGTKNITQDQTKYDYVVSALDIDTAEEIQSVLINPPDSYKYDALKKTLIKTFGKSQIQKDTEILNLNGLGDKRPTALLRKINALNDDPKTLKRALFLLNIPTDIRSILAGYNNTENIEELADIADRIWETRTTTINHISKHNSTEVQENTIVQSIDAITTKKTSFPPRQNYTKIATSPQPSVCFYHTKFGPDAKRCQPGCKFASLLNKSGKTWSGNDKAGH